MRGPPAASTSFIRAWYSGMRPHELTEPSFMWVSCPGIPARRAISTSSLYDSITFAPSSRTWLM